MYPLLKLGRYGDCPNSRGAKTLFIATRSAAGQPETMACD